MSRSRTYALAALLALVAALAFGAGWLDSYGLRSRPGAAPPPRAARQPTALDSAGSTPSTPRTPPDAPELSKSGLARQLGAPARDPGLGDRLRATVMDVRTGQSVYARGSASPAAPASTAKLLTAAAILSDHAATDRITTTVRAGTGGSIVLLGHGDPTLSAAPTGSPTAYPDAARLADLARQLQAAHRRISRIVVDDSFFGGPSVSPAWAPEDVPSDYASAVTAVMTDGGRTAPGASERSATPDLVAGRELAAALGRPNLSVARGRAANDSMVLASVRSAPIATLVEQMLQDSDNVIAECLGRQVAAAEHVPVTFRGAARAIRTVLRRLGVDPGDGMLDASGLAASDRVSTNALARVLVLAANGRTPRLGTLVAALPVGAWSGTLRTRYASPDTAAAAGMVRAKTGTLTGVSSLAGVVRDRSGRLLAFALIADQAEDTAAAEHALDALVGRLTRCGCDRR